MKNIFKTLTLFLAIVLLSGCHKITSEGVTKITFYPSITILGEELVVIQQGTTYSDAGCIVMENGVDVTDDVKTTSNVNTSAVGMYSVVYSATNLDGFSKSAARDVYVVNSSSFATVYWGESQYGAQHYYGAPIMITQRSDGNYLIDDLGGGLYFWGRYPGYEPTYDFHLEAILSLSADNTISLVAQGSWYWTTRYDMEFVSGDYDPDTQTVWLELSFDGDPFIVTLTGVQ